MSHFRTFLGKKGGAPRWLFVTLAAAAIGIGLPILLQFSSTVTRAETDVMSGLTANLTGDPIGNITPRGFGIYYESSSSRTLTVQVSNVNLPSHTSLDVFLNSTNIGTITLDMFHHGGLFLSTWHGGTVPMVVSGDTLSVKNGEATILSGAFAPPATPSPTATHTPFPTPTPGPAHAFAALLNGANEVPPVETMGRGAGAIYLNTADTSIRAAVGSIRLSSAVTAVTINGPAMVGENGPVIFTFGTPPGDASFNYQTFDVTPEQVADLRSGLWYFQIATADHPDGEVRGQIQGLGRVEGDGLSDENGTTFRQWGDNWYVSRPDQSVDVYHLALPSDRPAASADTQ